MHYPLFSHDDNKRPPLRRHRFHLLLLAEKNTKYVFGSSSLYYEINLLFGGGVTGLIKIKKEAALVRQPFKLKNINDDSCYVMKSLYRF